MCSSTHCSKPFAKYTQSDVSKTIRNSYTVMSPVEWPGSSFYEAKIVLYWLIVSFWRSWSLDLQGSKSKDVELRSEQDCLTGIKTLLCSKSVYTLCYGTKCRSIMSEMLCAKFVLKHHAQNIEVMLQMQKFICICSKAHTCRNSHVVFVHRAQLDNKHFLINCFVCPTTLVKRYLVKFWLQMHWFSILSRHLW